MASPLKQLAPCLWSIFMLLSFCHAKAEPCKCLDTEDRRSNYTMEGDVEFYLIDKESGLIGTAGLDFLRNLSGFEQKNTRVLSATHEGMPLLWQDRPDELGVDEASFSVNIVYQPSLLGPSGLAVLIIPLEDVEFIEGHMANETFMPQDDGPIILQGTPRNATVSGSSVSVVIGALEHNSSRAGIHDRIMAIDINIDASSSAFFSYAVWIDYDRVGHRLSAYVDVQGMPKPASAIAEAPFNFSGVAARYVGWHYYEFGLLSTVAQQLSVSRWNGTVEDLPYIEDSLWRKFDRESTILGSIYTAVAAMTAMTAIAVACYCSSKYRMWQKDLDLLARVMERLPGVPRKVEFADIKKATGNFHETMKLGGGGFGTVYRCTLPAKASKTERPMDVAVKRFTSEVQSRRYEDFLAEVSIINRLRHKNIVPLVGWSYNKGEPLLIFEFMTNSSLDQHLFPRGRSGTGNQRERPSGAAIRQWATRYGIIRDIATGLHYVHHEYEPMVLHRDIKASNVMIDSSFGARLGDFGLACTVANDGNSATGVAGTRGYIAPEYAMSGKATRQTDIYALGVLILEIVTGKQALIHHAVDDDDVHITDRVWRLHQQQRLPECLDAVVLASSSEDGEKRQLDVASDAERLLLLGLACSSPNPSQRPTMPEVIQVIAKSAPPPTVPLMKPRFVWPPEGVAWSDDNSSVTPMTSVSDLHMSTRSTREPHVIFGQPTVVSETRALGRRASLQLEQSVYITATSALV